MQALYCSEDCQEGDWARHGDYCRMVVERREERKRSKEQLNQLKVFKKMLGKLQKQILTFPSSIQLLHYVNQDKT